MQMQFKKTMTFKETMLYSGLSRKIIQSFVDNGNLKFLNVNINGAKSTNIMYRFLVSDVDKFLSQISQTMTEGKK
ncbi:MAG TPA: hypothetical protein DCP51_05845 [Clostridiales bacterium]|nr:hypothetical protein [Clostridiales bacterium]HCT85380.1 hypothetical protein [Candidatus Margulisiibacteriota bacterium]